MAANLFGRPVTVYVEAAQQDVYKEKSMVEKAGPPKFTVQHSSASPAQKYKWNIIWGNVMYFLYLHIAAVYGIYIGFTAMKRSTILFMFILSQLSGLGVTAGAHRLWSHRSYKAKWPLRFMLMILQTMAFQNSIYVWARDHRVHHKYTETDADPHNARRGFFFSHMGWLMVNKHPEILKKGINVDMSDLENDPIVVFQRNVARRVRPWNSQGEYSTLPLMTSNMRKRDGDRVRRMGDTLRKREGGRVTRMTTRGACAMRTQQ